MTEIEVPTEHLVEEIHHGAEHGGAPWFMGVALSSAFLAAFAAVAALMAGHYANDAMLEQIHASDSWSYYQAKGVKAAILNTKIEILAAQGHKVREADKEKVAEYKKEQAEITEKAGELEKESLVHLHKHEIISRAVTMFQVAIAISAISVLTRRKRFWFVSLGFGIAGLGFFIQGFL